MFKLLFLALGTNPWTCRQCGKQYQWRESLYKHIRIECGKPPAWECSICGRKFKHKHRWQSHTKLKHAISFN